MKTLKRLFTGTAASIMSLSLLSTFGFTAVTYAEPANPAAYVVSAR